MKVRLHYMWSDTGSDKYGHPPHLVALADTGEPKRPEWYVRDASFSPSEWGEIALARSFSTYLFGSLLSDFFQNNLGHVDEAIDAVGRIERGEVEEFDTGGQGFWHHITQDRVRFEHNVFGECAEWPIWCCTLAQYKAALLGYRLFLYMPKSIESELVIELPDGEPESC